MKLKKGNIFNKIINILLNILIVIFGIILLISVYTNIQTKLLGNDYPNFFGYSIFEVQTGSMADTINAGDCILVKLTQNVKLNDIVTYEQDGEYITHRVIEAYNSTYVTKGDANNAKDDPIDQKQIVGKVISVWRNLGILRKTILNPVVLIAFIITLFLFNLAFNKNSSNKLLDKINNKVRSLLNKKDKNKKIKPEEIKTVKVEEPKLEEIRKEAIKPVQTEEELEKTSLYRVISVDDNEQEETETPVEEKTEEQTLDKTTEDDLEKTSLFRVITVDADEVDNTFLEIAENQVKGTDKDKKVVEKVEEIKPEEINKELSDSLTNINLDLLQNKKNGGIIETAMLVKKEELNEIVEIILKNSPRPINKASIKNIFVDVYVKAKYNNEYDEDDVDYDGKNAAKLKEVLKKETKQLIADYQGHSSKYSEEVQTYGVTFILILELEHIYNTVKDTRAKEEMYVKTISKYFQHIGHKDVQNILSIQTKYKNTIDYFLDSLNTKMFDLDINKISVKKHINGIELKHNIEFSKIYSEYIIDKTYNEGIVAEDKITIMFTLLSIQLIKDMINAQFNNKYVLYIPMSLYSKERKLNSLLKMISYDYVKDRVFLLIPIKDLLPNKKILQKLRKSGYNFSIYINEETEISQKEKGEIYIANYLFADKKIIEPEYIKKTIPEDMIDNIIYENVTNYIGEIGGEN